MNDHPVAPAPPPGVATLGAHDFQQVVEQAAAGLWVVQQGRIVHANAAAAELLGRPLRELVGMDPVAVLGTSAVLGAPAAHSGREYRYRHPDGHTIDVVLSSRAAVVRGQAATVTVLHDVSTSRRLHETLSASQMRLDSLMNALADGVFVAQDHHFVLANPTLLKMLGHAQTQFIGLGFEQVVAPDVLALWTERFDRRVGGGAEPPRAYEITFLRRDGQRVELELMASRVQHDGRPAVLGVVREIGERKRNAAELARYRDHLEALVEQRAQALGEAVAQRLATEHLVQTITDNIPVRIAFWDRDEVCRFVNQAWCSWFGHTRDAVLGKPLRSLFSADSVRDTEHWRAAALAGQAQTVEREELSADGRKASIQMHYIPYRSEGRITGWCTLGFDVTLIQQSRAQLRTMNDELMLARDRAEAGTRAKSAFLANMSHEIRTPMNAVIGLTHLMRRDSTDPGQSDRIDKVSDAAQHLLHIVNDVLDLSRIESGKFELESIDFAIDALLSRCCALVNGAARSKGLELVIDSQGLPPVLRGDPTRLSQALVNLLGNAVKFTEQGSVTLHARVLQSDRDTLLRFEVRDTGIGIPADRQIHLFSAFEQADSSTTRRFGGSGLGLSITRHLAQLMGGAAGVRSQPGQGSTFWLTARLQPAQDQGVGDTGMRETPLAGRCALLVDDLYEARTALEGMLRQLGLRVLVAASGSQALLLAREAAAKGDPIAVAVVDVVMPGMDGLETVDRLQQQTAPGVAAPGCILVSAAVDGDLRRDALALGVDRVIEKPVSLSALHDALMATLMGTLAGTPSGTQTAAYTHVHTQPLPLDSHAELAVRTRHRGARVLLAEDNPINQEVATELLSAAGLQVDVAENGEQAVMLARGGGYALILMDMQMPVMDGLEASRAIRALPNMDKIPIIAMTANAFGEDRLACLAAGMNDHVAKPVDPVLLYDKLQRWLDTLDQPA